VGLAETFTSPRIFPRQSRDERAKDEERRREDGSAIRVSSFNRIVLNVPFDYLSQTTTIRLGAFASASVTLSRHLRDHAKGFSSLFGIPGMILSPEANESTRAHRDIPRSRNGSAHRGASRRALSRAGLFLSSALRERENPLTPLIRGEGRVYFSRMRRGQWRALPRGINHTAADRGEGRAASEKREKRARGGGEEEREGRGERRL